MNQQVELNNILNEMRTAYSTKKVKENYKKTSPNQKHIPFEKMRDLKALEDEVRSRFEKLTDGIKLEKGFLLSYLSQTTKKDRNEIQSYQTEITDDMRKRAGQPTIPYDDFMVDTVQISDDDKNMIYGKARKRGFAYELGDGEMDLTCVGDVFTYGNGKLPPSTLIFNMNSAKYCPSKECALKSVCYAAKSEHRFKDSLYRDLRNEAMLKYIRPGQLLKLAKLYIEKSPVRIKQIRLSVSGDFKSPEEVPVAEAFAKYFWQHYHIKTVVYTSRPFDFSQCQYLIVNASNIGVQFPSRYYYCRKPDVLTNMGIDTTPDKKIKQRTKQDGTIENYYFCNCDCYRCNFCYKTPKENNEDPSNKTVVYVEEHK